MTAPRRPRPIIFKAVERMTRLVTDLLDLSKLQAGQSLPLELARHDVAELTREALELLEPMARAKQLTLGSESAAAAPVVCDGPRVQQVLSNLLGNGMKFTRAGGAIAVRSRATADEVIVSVSDTGCGIPEEQIPHIFEAYWQSDPQRKRGAGLGPSIAKAIIDAHGRADLGRKCSGSRKYLPLFTAPLQCFA